MDKQLFIIGAPRSGTNILRNVLTAVDGVVTWPCDEINYIWRHGNLRVDNDELKISHAGAEVKQYIRSRFKQLEEKFPSHKLVLEKTCANSLRVEFLNEIFPESKFIFIYRDGYDVTFSARNRWRAPLEFKYLFEKVCYVPIVDLPFHAFNYARARLHKLLSKDKALKTWGPVFHGMQLLQPTMSIDEICAKQWEMCVMRSMEQLTQIEPERVYNLAYEDFVSDPKKLTKEILDFIGLDKDADEIDVATASVHVTSLDKGKKGFCETEIERLSPIIDPVNAFLNDKLSC